MNDIKLKKFETACEEIAGNGETGGKVRFINLTPHDIVLNSGEVIPPTAPAARVDSKHSEFDQNGICDVVFGDIINLPDPIPCVIYIVSAIVASRAAKEGRTTSDLVSPATGHPDCIRDKGKIISVPGFIRAQ